jgi:ubiquitin carboxyl-terminal hydrolase 14
MKVVVNVKWNKELYKDVEVDLEEPPEAFKIQIMSLTGVPIERQKVIGKGGMLQNDSWGKVTLKQGMTVMVMGTADEAMLPAKAEEPQFVEDLPEQVECDFDHASVVRLCGIV